MAAPLDDLTVVTIESWMAVPSAAAILADMGADLIKIEPISGDPMRGTGRSAKLPEELMGFDYSFDVANRGKRSIAVDLESEDGQDLVHRICADADVFMCNLLSRRQEKFNLDPDSLKAVNPRLVHATLTGYGTTGPEAWRPGYDVTSFFGRSGLYDAMREGEDGPPPMARPAQGDYTAGLAMVGGILAAVRMAERTGEGQTVETSLYESAVWTMSIDYSVTAMDRAPLRPRARENMVLATSNRFPCGDGKWLVINMPQESAWPKMCAAMGLDHLVEDERLGDIRGRFKNMPEIVAAIDGALSAKSRDEWGEIFDEAGIVWGPVLGLHEVVSDPQAEALGLFPEMEHESIGTYRSVAVPMRFDNADVGPKGSAPTLGEHSREILGEAGFSEAEIQKLVDDGTVGLG